MTLQLSCGRDGVEAVEGVEGVEGTVATGTGTATEGEVGGPASVASAVDTLGGGSDVSSCVAAAEAFGAVVSALCEGLATSADRGSPAGQAASVIGRPIAAR